MNENLIIEDKFFSNMADYFKKQGTYYEENMKNYIRVLKSMNNNGICSGRSAESLKKYIEDLELLEGVYQELGALVHEILINYLTTIDQKDSYIF